jgi:beta-carotene hydroxylase
VTAPTLDELGRDLLRVPRWRLVPSLAGPFVLCAAFFGCAAAGWWVPATACVVALSFATYGSISHDLVHRSLGLPRRVNDALLTAIELLLLRSGRAYRLAHLNHHARYPERGDDPEAVAAHGTFWAAVRSGPTFFFRLWWWATRRHPAHRPRLIAEGAVVLAAAAGAVAAAAAGWSVVPLAYAALAYLGTWVVPLATAYVPHTPSGDTPLSQTRRFRGRVARLLALDHLYHLEHHLYPAVPHHRWAELARRLDPHLDRAGVPVVRLGV